MNDIYKNRFFFMLLLIAICWIVQIMNFSLGYSLVSYGVVPRTLEGLIGIFTSPFLHASFSHIISNTLSFLFLGLILTLVVNKDIAEISFLIAICSGLMVWLFAGNGYHVGLSGLIFGYFGFIIASMFYSFNVKVVILGFFVFIFYWTMIFGILPIKEGISWEGHLFGLISGIFISKFYFKVNK